MKNKFKDSLFYQIRVSEKFFTTLFEQYFKELNIGVSAMEHIALCIIDETPECCQRDLARIIVKDRAGTGKLAAMLQKKGLIEIELKTKNNRLVKILTLTQKGKELVFKTQKIGITIQEKINETLSQKAIDETKKNLKAFRETIKAVVKNKI